MRGAQDAGNFIRLNLQGNVLRIGAGSEINSRIIERHEKPELVRWQRHIIGNVQAVNVHSIIQERDNVSCGTIGLFNGQVLVADKIGFNIGRGGSRHLDIRRFQVAGRIKKHGAGLSQNSGQNWGRRGGIKGDGSHRSGKYGFSGQRIGVCLQRYPVAPVRAGGIPNAVTAQCAARLPEKHTGAGMIYPRRCTNDGGRSGHKQTQTILARKHRSAPN